jgi:hypothetical protein
MHFATTLQVKFFFGGTKTKGSAIYFGGIAWLLFFRSRSMIVNGVGMLIEGYGLLLLFSGFLPRIIPLMRSLPVVSSIFVIPGVSALADKITAGSSPV